MQSLNKICRTFYLVVLTFLASILVSYPQNQPKTLPLSQAVEGLSSPVVLSVYKDSHGFMWFGTNSGLYRYDGYEFKLFQSDPGDTTTISNATIWRILCEDKNGYLWIASIDQVLNRYDFHTNKFKRYNLKSMVANQKRWIDKAYPDAQGNIWFIPNDFGIINYSSSTDNFSKSYPDPDEIKSKQNIITSVIEDKSGTFYVFSKEGNFILNRETNIYTPFIVDDSPANFQHAEILESLEDKYGILWFGTDKGFFKYSKDINKIDYIPYQKNDLSPEGDDPLYYQFYLNPLDEGNTFWIKNDLGMNKFDPSDESFSHYMLQPDDQLSYYRGSWGSYGYFLDESAKLWLATDISGVRVLDLKENPFRSFQIKSKSDKPEYYNASTFLKDNQNNVWVGTNYGGLVLYDSSMKLKRRFFNEFGTLGILNNISALMYSIYEDSDGIIWIGTWGLGLVLYDRSTDKMLHCLANPPPGSFNQFMRVGGIVEDRQKTIWVGTGNGLYYLKKEDRLDTNFQRVDSIPWERSWIRDLCVDHTGSVWLATDADGLFRVSTDKQDSIFYTHYINDPQNPNSLSSNSVYSVYYTKDTLLWIGSIAGLDCFSFEDNSFAHYDNRNGLDANMVYDIESDNSGFLWMSTNNGLVRFNPKDGPGLKSKKYTKKDGLPYDNIFPYVFYCSSDGEIFCGGRRGTNNGFFCFNADSLKDNIHIPPVVITDFKVRNKVYALDTSITQKKQIRLKYHQNFFSF